MILYLRAIIFQIRPIINILNTTIKTYATIHCLYSKVLYLFVCHIYCYRIKNYTPKIIKSYDLFLESFNIKCVPYHNILHQSLSNNAEYVRNTCTPPLPVEQFIP